MLDEARRRHESALLEYARLADKVKAEQAAFARRSELHFNHDCPSWREYAKALDALREQENALIVAIRSAPRRDSGNQT